MLRPLLLLCFLLLSLQAHQLRENYLHIEYEQKTKLLKLSLEVETRLLEDEHLIDDNQNGIISFKELQNHQDILRDYTLKHFRLIYHKSPLSLSNAIVIFHRYQDQTYMQLSKTFSNIELDRLQLNYDMFFELEDIHKLLIHLDKERGDAILSKTDTTYDFSNFKMSNSKRLVIFVKSGIEHILDGLDHLLFILMILLPTLVTLHLNAKKNSLKKHFIDILKIITTFSLAHSITLFIAGTNLYRPPTSFIESSIALSIFIVAFMNFSAYYRHVNKKIVFIFGLLHGFGFANVLEIAHIETTMAFITALFGFNLGVEFGQIAVILTLLPLLYLIAKSPYAIRLIKFLSFVAMVISAYWFLQRIGLV